MYGGVLKIDILNDYQGEIQDCIASKIGSSSASKDVDRYLELNNKFSNVKPNLILLPENHSINTSLNNQTSAKTSKSSLAAQVRLNDCLACSGCVTSDETSVIKQQSLEYFQNSIKDYPYTILSISTETIDFVSSYYKLSARTCFKLISYILKVKLGVFAVFDTVLVDAFNLVEILREFLKRFEECYTHNILHNSDSPNLINSSSCKKNIDSLVSPQKSLLPLFTSHCPGWIHFLKSKKNDNVLKQVTPMKSTQQIIGYLIKTLVLDILNLKLFFYRYKKSNNNNNILFRLLIEFLLKNKFSTKNDQNLITPNDIYHTTVVPCYDKKLEIFRNYQNTPIREIDSILTTVELIELLENLGIEHILFNQSCLYNFIDDLFLGTSLLFSQQNMLPQLPDELKKYINTIDESLIFNEYFQHPSAKCFCCHNIRLVRWNGLSGGFLEYIFRQAAQRLFGTNISDSEQLNSHILFNKEFKEVTLKNNGQISLRFILAYGFRNLQNIVSMLTQNPEYKVDFVEVMACPRGCQYGGGQMVPPTHTDTKHKHIDPFTNSYPEDIYLYPHQHPLLPILYKYLIKNIIFSSNHMFNPTYFFDWSHSFYEISKESISW